LENTAKLCNARTYDIAVSTAKIKPIKKARFCISLHNSTFYHKIKKQIIPSTIQSPLSFTKDI
jgi:hypothetical protein